MDNLQDDDNKSTETDTQTHWSQYEYNNDSLSVQAVNYK